MKQINSIPVITIDGPSGTGKGTVSVLLAHRLGWNYLDSGALYRLLALQALAYDIESDNVDGLVQLAQRMDVKFMSEEGRKPTILLEGHDVTEAIRSEYASSMSSKVSAHPPVRAALMALKRSFRQAPGLVTDGRDMGTVVFPEAELKIFMTASVEVRAQRRYEQLIKQGINANLGAVQQEMEARDARDRNRPVAPLKPADDAVIVDTSTLTVEAVLATILDLVRERLAEKGI